MKRISTGIYQVTPTAEGMKVVRGGDIISKEYPDYLKDESNVHGSKVVALFFPCSIEHISYVMKEAHDNRIPLTVSGGRTGICAGAVPEDGGFVVSLEKMNRILALQHLFGEFRLSAECGIRLNELAVSIKSKDLDVFDVDEGTLKVLKESDRSFFYPPDPTETTATLGGTVATNASGARTLFYGPTRNYVVGIEVVLPDGDLLRIKRGEIFEKDGVFKVHRQKGAPLIIPAPTYAIPKTKHSAGLYSCRSMDLIDLFIGSEGILGIIATVTVRLIEEPLGFASGVAFFSSEEDAVNFVQGARESSVCPLALEYFDRDSLELLEEVRKDQGPTSEIPEISEFGAAVYFESGFGYNEHREVGPLGTKSLETKSLRTMSQGTKSLVTIFLETKSRVTKSLFIKWKELIQHFGGDPSIAWGAINKRDLMRLKIFRHAVPEMVNKIIAQNKLYNPRIHKVGTDMAVPDRALKEIMHYYRTLLAKDRLKTVIFGHIGNNHLHVNILPRSDAELASAKNLYRKFAEKAVSLGGSISAEHGIGKMKKEYLHIQYPKKSIDEMKAIKRALDPHHLLNPGNVI